MSRLSLNSLNPQNMPEHKQMLLPDGRLLGYADYGLAEGKPLVYCHGGGSSRLDIKWAHEWCRQSGIRLIAIDRPGIGLSSRQPGRTMLDWSSDVRYFAGDQGLDRFAVLGWSIGVPYALACAYGLGDLVSRVGCVGGLGYPSRPVIEKMGLLIDRLMLSWPRWTMPLFDLALSSLAMLPPDMVKRLILSHLDSAADREIVSALPAADCTDFFYEAVRAGSAGTTDDHSAMVRAWQFNPADIGVETILWHGDEDSICAPELGQDLCRQLQRARYIAVPGQGHFLLHKMLPEIVCALVQD